MAAMIELIPFDPKLTTITRSVTATLVSSRLEQLFARTGGATFTKFLAPAPGHSLYKPGEAWTENLHIAPEIFRTAFDRIGVRFKSRTAYEAAVAEGRQVVGTDGRTPTGGQELTHYVRNGPKISGAMRRLRQQV
jgi:hypothetical protein